MRVFIQSLFIWLSGLSHRQKLDVFLSNHSRSENAIHEVVPAVGYFCNGSLLTSSFNHNRKPYTIHIEYRTPDSNALLCALHDRFKIQYSHPISSHANFRQHCCICSEQQIGYLSFVLLGRHQRTKRCLRQRQHARVHQNRVLRDMRYRRMQWCRPIRTDCCIGGHSSCRS